MAQFVKYVFTLVCANIIFLFGVTGNAQVIDLETFGTGSFPGPPLPAGQTTYTYNGTASGVWPDIVQDGEYTIGTNTNQAFNSWANINDHTTGTGYMLIVNATAGTSDEFYRKTVSLTANTTYDFLSYMVTANSQADYDYCTNNEGGLVLPNVKFAVEDMAGNEISSLITGDIPFNATPQWQEYKLSFTTPATTNDVQLVLSNLAPGGCGNDIALDDITFRVAVTMNAQNDTGSLYDSTSGASNILNVISNDDIDGNPISTFELALASGSSLPPELTFNTSTGAVGVTAGAASGTYSFDYEICETNLGYNCDISTVTITITNPAPPSSASCPAGTTLTAQAGYADSAKFYNNNNAPKAAGAYEADGTNDTGGFSEVTYYSYIELDMTGAADEFIPAGADVTLSLTSAWGTAARADISVSFDGSTFDSLGSIGNGGTLYGTWASNTLRHDTITIPQTLAGGGARYIRITRENSGVRVDGASYAELCITQPVINAENDNATVTDGLAGASNVLNVVDNDDMNGNPLSSFVLSVASGSSVPQELSFNTSTGQVDVAPGTASGIYSFDYQICEDASATNCDTATVTITVLDLGGGGSCPAGTTLTTQAGYADSAKFYNNNNAPKAAGAYEADGTNDTGGFSEVTYYSYIELDMTGAADEFIPAGADVTLSLTSAWGTAARADISVSFDGSTFDSLGSIGNGGTLYGTWASNTLRHDTITIPQTLAGGGARYIRITRENSGVRVDGASYAELCVDGGAGGTAVLSASKSVTVYDPQNTGLYALPGNDVIYTITVTNTGDGPADLDSIFLTDIFPNELLFYSGDIDGPTGPETDPVAWNESNTNLTFTYSSDVRFSDQNSVPTSLADCNYTPAPNSYDSAVTYICFNPKGSMNFATPAPELSLSFRAQIQ